MFVFNRNSIATKFTFLFSVFFAVKFWSLSGGGDILNRYPYISPDGFDWYLEGVYLIKLVGGISMPELPVLRPPVFVLVTALDYVFGRQGLILALVSGLTIFGVYYFSLKIINMANSLNRGSSWCAIPIAISACVYPLNFIRPFILADSLAVTLALASVYSFLRYQANPIQSGALISSALLATASGLTQAYALLPFLMACSIAILLNFSGRNKKIIEYVLAIAFTVMAYVLVTYIWRFSIPHKTTPEQFTLLKLTSDMSSFYVKTWSFYFFPIILFLIFSRAHSIILNFKNCCHILFLSLASVFALLIFFYQWPEARFTYYLWPWVIISFFTVVNFHKRSGLRLITSLMFLMILLVPPNYWGPSWGSVKVSLVHNWIGDYFSAHKVDRGLALCSEDCVDKNEFLKNSDSYVNSTIFLYQHIKDL